MQRTNNSSNDNNDVRLSVKLVELLGHTKLASLPWGTKQSTHTHTSERNVTTRLTQAYQCLGEMTPWEATKLKDGRSLSRFQLFQKVSSFLEE